MFSYEYSAAALDNSYSSSGSTSVSNSASSLVAYPASTETVLNLTVTNVTATTTTSAATTTAANTTVTVTDTTASTTSSATASGTATDNSYSSDFISTGSLSNTFTTQIFGEFHESTWTYFTTSSATSSGSTQNGTSSSGSTLSETLSTSQRVTTTYQSETVNRLGQVTLSTLSASIINETVTTTSSTYSESGTIAPPTSSYTTTTGVFATTSTNTTYNGGQGALTATGTVAIASSNTATTYSSVTTTSSQTSSQAGASVTASTQYQIISSSSTTYSINLVTHYSGSYTLNPDAGPVTVYSSEAGTSQSTGRIFAATTLRGSYSNSGNNTLTTESDITQQTTVSTYLVGFTNNNVGIQAQTTFVGGHIIVTYVPYTYTTSGTNSFSLSSSLGVPFTASYTAVSSTATSHPASATTTATYTHAAATRTSTTISYSETITTGTTRTDSVNTTTTATRTATEMTTTTMTTSATRRSLTTTATFAITHAINWFTRWIREDGENLFVNTATNTASFSRLASAGSSATSYDNSAATTTSTASGITTQTSATQQSGATQSVGTTVVASTSKASVSELPANTSAYDSIEQICRVPGFTHNPDLAVFGMTPFMVSSETASVSQSKGVFEATSQSQGGTGTSTVYTIDPNASATTSGKAAKISPIGTLSVTATNRPLSAASPFPFSTSNTVRQI